MGHYEILGAEELISGDSLVSGDLALGAYEILGAMEAERHSHGHHRGHAGHRGHGERSRASILREEAYRRQAQGGSVVRETGATKSRRQVLGMKSTGVVPANTAGIPITQRPQTFAFRPETIIVPATIAPDFDIEDIKCGNISQLVANGSVAAEGFVQNAYNNKMEMDTVQTSQDFVLVVSNISGADRTFRANVYGRSLNQ